MIKRSSSHNPRPPRSTLLRSPLPHAGDQHQPDHSTNGSRYITVAENNREELDGAPVSLHIIEIILDRINPYEARFADFFNNESPATYSSQIQIAGAPFTGKVALNPEKDVIEIFGAPYPGTIGFGNLYPEGYQGPDIQLYAYLDQTRITQIIPATDSSDLESTGGSSRIIATVNGALTLAFSNSFTVPCNPHQCSM